MDTPREGFGIDALSYIEKHSVEEWVRNNGLDGLSVTREQLELLLVRLQLPLDRVAAMLGCHEALLARKATRWAIRPANPAEKQELPDRRDHKAPKRGTWPSEPVGTQERAKVRSRLKHARDWVVENDPNVNSVRDINIYYVYLHRHPVTQETLYVGKGVDSRAWAMLNRYPEHTAVLYKLLQEGHAPGSWVSLVKWGLTEYEALALEDKLQRDLVKQNVKLLNRLKPPVAGRAQYGWRNAEKKLPENLRSAAIRAAAVKELNSCDIATQEGLHKAVELSLALVPPDTFYMSMWELLSQLGLPRRGRAMANSKARIIAVFEAGIDGWFLDEASYIRRNFE